jgi:hypothetical protein
MHLIKSPLFCKKFRRNYWSCGPVAHWILSRVSHDKPNAATSEDWAIWHKTLKTNHPYVDWIVETALDDVQDIICFPLDVLYSIEVYVRNRFVDRLHYIPTYLPKGRYHEIDTRLLHGLFSLLADHVECDKAHMHMINNESIKLSGWDRHKATRYRNAEYGLAYLDWEIGLESDSPFQSATAVEIKDLYIWWTKLRPNRPDPWVVYGAQSDNTDETFDNFWDRSLSLQERTDMDAIHELERQYEEEDTANMKRLIDIRSSLWT